MKTCQACGHRPAIVEFIQISGDDRREMSLCQECALSIGMRSQVEAFQRLSQLLMQQQQTTGHVSDEMRAALAAKCARCGLIFEEFVKTGLLGCPACYESFGDLLKPVLRRMHGVTKQAGEKAEPAAGPARNPSGDADSGSREQLEIELNLALIEEDYERAAALRDRLKRL